MKFIRFLSKAYAFLKKDFRNEVSYKFHFLLQLFTLFINVSLFFFLSKLIGSSSYLTEYGGDYFSFLLIGVAFNSYLEVALTGISKSIREGQMMGTLEALIATQTDLATIIFSSSLYSFLFTSVRIILFILIGILVYNLDLSHANYPGALIVLVLSIFAFISFGILSASFIMYFKKGDPFSVFFSSVSWLLGGAYYPVEILPQWLESVSYLLPITHSLKAMRLALLQGYGIVELMPYILILILFIVLLMPVSFYCFSISVNKAKENGTLIQY